MIERQLLIKCPYLKRYIFTEYRGEKHYVLKLIATLGTIWLPIICMSLLIFETKVIDFISISIEPVNLHYQSKQPSTLR